ncbi:hypothetical protein FAIPA1_10584 [Frankia sp. AiPs1]
MAMAATPRLAAVRLLARRLLASFDLPRGVLRYYGLMRAPDRLPARPASRPGVAVRTHRAGAARAGIAAHNRDQWSARPRGVPRPLPLGRPSSRLFRPSDGTAGRRADPDTGLSSTQAIPYADSVCDDRSPG